MNSSATVTYGPAMVKNHVVRDHPIRIPPINTLIAFEVVARTQSFSAAADELCITRGAVSHRITALETYLGTEIVTRGPRKVTLTRAGATYLKAVSESLALLKKAAVSISRPKDLHHLRINALPAFAGSWLIARLPQFQSQYRHIEVEVDPLTYPLQEFDEVGLDLAIRYTEGVPEGFTGYCVKTVSLYPVCSPDYLMGNGPLKQPADLLRARLLHHNSDPWAIWFKAANVAADVPPPAATFGDGRLLLDAAIKGYGVALARDMLASDPVKEGSLIRVFDLEVPSPASYYALLKGKPTATTRAFLDWILKAGNRS